MATRMQQRRGTAAQWISTNSGNGPILNAGEIGYETDTNKFKIGDGTNHWVDLAYFLDITALGGSLDEYIPLTQKGAANGVATLNSSGLLDSSQIPNVDEITQDAINSALVGGDGITKTYDDAGNTITLDVDITSGDGLKIASNKLTVDATVVQKRVANVSDTEIGYLDGVTSAIQTQLNAKAASADITELAQDAVNTALTAGTGITKTYDDAGNTITVAVDTTAIQARVANVSDTEIGYLDGVTSAIQTQMNAKAPLASPTFTGTVTLPSGTVTSTMILDGTIATADIADSAVTSAKIANDTIVDADINSAAAITKTKISGTAITAADTGTVTSTMILDGTIVDGDINASAAIAQSKVSGLTTDLAAKAPLASPTFTGTVNAANLTLSGNLTVSGTTTTVNTTSFEVADPLVYLGTGNSANLVDLGFAGHFDNGTYQHTGLVRDASDGKWKLFSGVVEEPTTTINFTSATYDTLKLGAVEATSATIGNVSNTELQYLDGVTSAIQTQLDSKLSSSTASSTYAPINAPTFTGTVSGITKSMVGLENVDNTADSSKPVSTAQQTALDLKANLAGPTFTGTVVLPSTTSIGNVSATELGYVDGVTSAIQTQLDAKLASSTASSTYAPLNSPTFTGTVSGITKAMVGLGNVENTALSTWAGSTNITTLGTVATGTWSASTIALNKGGTGATTQAGAANAVLPAQTSANGKYLTSDGTNVSWGTVSSYSAPTLGSTSIGSGATVTTIAGLTLSGATLTGSLTANSSAGTSGQVLSSTGTGVQWITPAAGAAFSELMLIGA